MNYNQLQFWVLFAFVLVPYRWLPHRAQNRLLLVASYVFYGFWDYRFLFLIFVSTVVDYIGGLGVAGVQLSRRRLAGLGSTVVLAALLLTSGIHYSALLHGDLVAALPDGIDRLEITAAVFAAVIAYGALLRVLYGLPATRRRKAFLVVSMIVNLGILGFFKYCDFFIGNVNALLSAIGVTGTSVGLLKIVLPAGISFYTFQAMSYTIDIYRGELEPTERFDDFALFVCFFPHLVAGPIMRAHRLLPQVANVRRTKSADLEEGLLLVLVGLFKKVALSDNVAPIANAVFFRLARGDTAGMTAADVLVGIYAFAIQIYGDFSGYSSIARGISKWLGFELVINFRQPYIAVSPSDFWRRWHISLSTWLRDYLYIPLGGNRNGVRAEYRNLMITMLLGGLWHGARWTFVAWGLYHGIILCAFRMAGVRDVTPRNSRWRWALRVFVMFHLTCLGWLLFRADSFSTVERALSVIVHNPHITMLAVTPLAMMAFYSLAIFVLEWFTEGEERLPRLMQASPVLQGVIYAYLVTMILVFPASHAYDFIYFQF
ncbi:MAG TPA: MBOAT family O-acyltransferase [Kofleriaceae bacterium]